MRGASLVQRFEAARIEATAEEKLALLPPSDIDDGEVSSDVAVIPPSISDLTFKVGACISMDFIFAFPSSLVFKNSSCFAGGSAY